MTLFLLSYLAGILTILSPCIWPVLPFVLARSDRPFRQGLLPLLAGMALTFAFVASLGAIAGGWAVAANQYARIAAVILLGLFGAGLLFPTLSERLTRPLVSLGARIAGAAERRRSEGSDVWPSMLLGVATGLLWAPCAGPVLALILTGAALLGPNSQSFLLLLAYAGGAATSLSLAFVAGGRLFAVLKRGLGFGDGLRRVAGALVLASVVVVGLGLDASLLAPLSANGTTRIEQKLLDLRGTSPAAGTRRASMAASLPIEGVLPSLSGAKEWLNSPPLAPEALRGKVVLVNFWTYSCINCLRTLPYVRAWAEKYRDQGLVVVGVHTPEFAFEKSVPNVLKATKDLGVGYPVAIDNDFSVWRAFDNSYWPALYFVDAEGQIRHHQFGEGNYDVSERVIQALLAEAGNRTAPVMPTALPASGTQAPADPVNLRSGETYLGYRNAANFVPSGGLVRDRSAAYRPASHLLNEWSLDGKWTVRGESAELDAPGGVIGHRFHARDLHLVLGSKTDGMPVRFRVTLDGKPPGDDRGSDVDAAGLGVVTDHRLYQLVRQSGPVADREFRIEFLDPGVQAYAFTFG
ncbi:cytochrome c biogenesis protein DipZ [Flaviflagellibacter deserti]|uniref:Cytochrome c biogenesis protein DipZ n=1 Tax=Flaviflagellibacter deserti TaxID=2267266 RepID=A0ABV9YZW8_9HYPH